MLLTSMQTITKIRLMCVEVIVCYNSVAFLRHSVDSKVR